MRVFEGFRTVALEQFLHVGRACDDMLGGDFHILRFHGAGAVLQNGNLGFFLRGGGDEPFRLEEQEADEAKDCQAKNFQFECQRPAVALAGDIAHPDAGRHNQDGQDDA